MSSHGSIRIPSTVRGSVVVQRRRCGKPTCRCAAGVDLHESTVLSYSDGGRNRTLMLAPEEVPAVRAAVARYRRRREAAEQAGNAGLDALLARRGTSRRDA